MGYRIVAYDKPTDKDGFIVYDQNLATRNLVSGSLNLKLTDIDDLDLTVNQLNPLYDRVEPLITHIEVYEDDELIFRGRAIKPTKEMASNGGFTREYIFEAIDAYLLDSIQRFDNDSGSSAKQYLQRLIKVHNDQLDDKYKHFQLGKCDFSDSEGIIQRQIDYPTTKEAITAQLINKTGGYIRIRYDHDKQINYIDYTKTIGVSHKADTPISVGKNMLSAKQTIDPTGIITRLIPLGKVQPAPKTTLGDDDTVDENGVATGITHAVNGDWGPAIRNAGKVMGVTISDEYVQKIKNMIRGESNGSETVVNGWDANAQAGHPSAGLLQFVENTFQNYMVKPFTTWKSGFDQLCALFNMTDWKAEVDKWQIYHSWSPNGKRRLTEVSSTTTHKGSLNSWGWPFPSVGEGHFMDAQLFGVHAGNGRTNNFHDGLDFGSIDHSGSEVHAIHGGTVTRIGNDGYIGWYVVTHSRDGYDIVYQEGFSSRGNIRVSQGQTIKTGDVIGIRDTSHVHIGVTKKSWYEGYTKGHSFDPNWAWLDPLKLIKEGGQKGDSDSHSKTYEDESPQPRFNITSVNGGKDYIEDADLIKQFGVIEGTQIFDDLQDPAQIKQMGEKWLANEKRHVTKNSFEVSALELPEFDRFKVGDFYQFINPQVSKTAQLLQVVEKDIDFAHERNSSLKIADVAKSLTDYQIEDSKKVDARFRSIQKTLTQQSLTIANLSSGAMSVESNNNQVNQSINQVSEQSNFDAKYIKDELDKHLKDYAEIKKIIDDLPNKYVTSEQLKVVSEKVDKLEQKGESNG
ncbi:phage tail protein [Lactobacillus johnsonii]|uniref:Peptidase M23 n=1 Tax=Lactobacillus johnsonii TaxID=33959 RepID=A0A9X6NZN3_LACJH|nr:phage tail protein [Lactobacillus johnsonii]OYS01797.1 peptidase M23 [Lactobacillus johnsonii]OYS07111.1 peptidase M23 [Lactobacillus johnsonii]OYS07690.1 peptidase M23 [Lactobacillus johnsonii]OYS10316.1 peptidase M23 [Lactobacillus johnsonii]OYS11471.1 peptidase M23 [Lactobacillus johnsonii]